MTTESGSCDLCGLPLRLKIHSFTISEEVFRFCCLGCRQVFQLLFEAAPRVDPSSFRETELFRKCREMGIIPASSADLAWRSTGGEASPAAPVDGTAAAGTGATGREMLSLQLTVRGMWCPACAWAIEETLKRTPGVGPAACNFSTDRVRCDYDPVQVSPRQVIDQTNSLGYTASLPGDGTAGR